MIPNNICFIDLETLPSDATVGMDLTKAPGWEPEPVSAERKSPPKNWKDPKKIIEWEAKEQDRYLAAVEEAKVKQQADALSKWRKGSLSGLHGRIACISLAFGEEEVEVIDCAEDEKAGLVALAERVALQRSALNIRQITFVAQNGLDFDFPLIQIRALKYGSTKLAALFHQEKPWDGVLEDPSKWWPKMGYRDFCPKLGVICEHLGIDHDEDNPISGAEVLDAYVRGDWDQVIAHAKADVRDLRSIYKILKAVRS